MPFEIKIIEFLQSFSSTFLDGFFMATSYLFDYPLVIIVALILLCYKKYSYLFLFLSVELVGFITQITLKSIINRPRPFINNDSILNILEASNSSFPSGHSITCMCAVVVLWYIISKSSNGTRQKNIYKSLLVVAAILCAVNRMYLGQHYITDVLGGFIIAIIISICGIFVYKKITKRLIKTNEKA